MKKIMWFISIIPLFITVIMLQFIPDLVPMHYDFSGKIDRWGSKYEELIFPLIILVMALFWQLFILYFERKARNTKLDKERAEAVSNAKVLKVVAISIAVMFGIMQGFSLYGAYIEANTNATHSYVDIGKVSCILLGVLFIVIGNFMPKTRKNRTVGVRVRWSMYNDITWMKSNRFGAVALIVAGLLTIVTAIFVNSMMAVLLLLGYLLAATAVTLIYAHKVYLVEISKENRR